MELHNEREKKAHTHTYIHTHSQSSLPPPFFFWSEFQLENKISFQICRHLQIIFCPVGQKKKKPSYDSFEANIQEGKMESLMLLEDWFICTWAHYFLLLGDYPLNKGHLMMNNAKENSMVIRQLTQEEFLRIFNKSSKRTQRPTRPQKAPP